MPIFALPLCDDMPLYGSRTPASEVQTLSPPLLILWLLTVSHRNYKCLLFDYTMGDSAYSFSLTTFSRTGKLLQIEYALNAVANGRTALGICAVDGVVLATDKKVPSVLVDTEDMHKIEAITPTTGFCYAGVGPDYRVLGKSLAAPE